MIWWVPMVLLALAAVVDWRTHLIPDWIPGALVAFAVCATAIGLTSTGWIALAGGALTGLAIGAGLFALGGFGGGDAKLLCGMGAVLGPMALLGWLVHVAICGALMAVVALVRHDRELAYAPAMAVGLVSWRLFGNAW